MVFLLPQSYIVKPFATIPKCLPQPCWHWLTGGTFDSATGGTFHSDTPGTFESDMDGTFKVPQSDICCDTETAFLPLRQGLAVKGRGSGTVRTLQWHAPDGRLCRVRLL